MKNWLRSTPCKITSFILCLVMLAITVAGIVGVILMIDAELYYTPLEVTTRQLQESLVWSDADELLYGDGQYRYSQQNTNLRYRVVNSARQTVDTNITGQPKLAWQYAFHEAEGEHFYAERHDPSAGPASSGCTVYLYLEPELPADDRYAFFTDALALAYGLRYWVWIIAGLALVLSILFFILLLCAAGRKPHSDGLHPGVLHRVPFDILVLCALLTATLGLNFSGRIGSIPGLVMVCLWCLLCVSMGIGLCMSMAVRVKDRSLLKNTLLGHALRLLKKLWKGTATLAKNLPLIWQAVLVVIAVGFWDSLTLMASLNHSPVSILLWLVQNLVLAGALLYGALSLRKLQAGGEALARGDLGYQTDTGGMLAPFRRHGENLNSIASGMSAAVEQRLRSERLKTELITNVSHDIKTPLTSIINYATLIGQTPCECPQHTEYAEVLVRKSGMLRRLLDDLVEASRASTGNLEVVLAPCDAGVLLTQAAGEYEQRCAEAGLELLTSRPEQPVMVLADSRRIWRIFENLMGNICKYSLSGTRVFLRLEAREREAVITFRNTANSVLNISPEALTERFVRGDSARSTEGSGLGLSIAQSLTQLQGGKMDITIDGDLFIVTLRFPLA